jgi:hypothetical protein
MDCREALIMAAVCGWKGDDQSAWQSPIDLDTILDWAQSHMDSVVEIKELESEFRLLEKQGLFFLVHPDVFIEPVYYCSYDELFLSETFPDSQPDPFAIWMEWKEEYDEDYGQIWRQSGLCLGQGSQGYSTRSGPCLGKECTWYKDNKPGCNWGLEFSY